MRRSRFPGRGAGPARRPPPLPRERCKVCRVPPSLCVCARLPRIGLPFRVVLVQHGDEMHRQSNTGALVHRLLADSRVVPYGIGEGHDVALSSLEGRDWATHVLFPIPGARPVTPNLLDVEGGQRLSLVVLDATWRQARRMSRRIPGLRQRPFVALPEGLVPRWPLRRPTRDGQLSTAEAIAWATALLGLPGAADEIWRALALVATRILHVRGKLSREALGASRVDC